MAAAASAARADDWRRTEQHLAEAVSLLEAIREPVGSPLTPAVEDYEVRAEALLEAIGPTHLPPAEQIRQLAMSMLVVP